MVPWMLKISASSSRFRAVALGERGGLGVRRGLDLPIVRLALADPARVDWTELDLTLGRLSGRWSML